jgi:hypothetical protein
MCVFSHAQPDGLQKVGAVLGGSNVKLEVIPPEVMHEKFLSKLQGSFGGQGPHIFHFDGHQASGIGKLALQDAWTLPLDEDGHELVKHTDIKPALRFMATTSPLCGLVLNAFFSPLPKLVSQQRCALQRRSIETSPWPRAFGIRFVLQLRRCTPGLSRITR